MNAMANLKFFFYHALFKKMVSHKGYTNKIGTRKVLNVQTVLLGQSDTLVQF